MVCPRCVTAVEHLLEVARLKVNSVRLGEVELAEAPSQEALQQLAGDLLAAGFELLDDRKKQVIENVKNLLIQKVQAGGIEDHFSVSRFLSEHIYKDYSAISKLFSEVEGITLEQFFLLQKIEKAKEWLIYNEHSLSEIALELGYSSSQHLSNQFKKLTGMTPSQFRQMGASHRKSIDDVAR